MKTLLRRLTLLALVCSPAAFGEVRLPVFFSPHLVLQRDRPVPIWGRAAAGEEVTVTFAAQRKATRADASGRWSVTLDPLVASGESRALTVRGTNTITLTDVVVGEVWLASGQSNMAFPLSAAHNAAAALAAAADPLLRFFTVQHATAVEPQTNLHGRWDLSDPAAAKGFSAVAYFFARELRQTLHCPVAILHSSWGGTAAQTWLSLDALRQEPPFSAYLRRWDDALARHREVQADPERAAAYRRELKQWQAEVAPAFSAAMKAYAAGKSAGPKPVPSRPEPPNPDPMGMPSPSARPNVPSVIYNAQIAPLAGYALRGALWYQGEANGSAGLEYRALLPRLIADWRARWAQGDFPFLIVQLPGWNHDPKPAELHDWPWLREAQALTARLVPYTGLAVTIDVGDPNDVHPSNKLEVGRRLARVARAVAYGEDLVASGPTFRAMTIEGPAVQVGFDNIGAGLVIGQAPWRPAGVEPLPTDTLIGFTIAGADRVWREADARVDGNHVVLSHPAVAAPVAIRYAWANAPRGNLYNREGLPAAPFRTDDWPAPPARP